jgi:hypothetical protein
MSNFSKRTFLKYTAGGLAAVAPFSLLLAQATNKDDTKSNMPQSQEKAADGATVQYLFVQTAQTVTSEGDQLTLHNVSPATLFFSDRPERIVGHGATTELVEDWSKGNDSFAADPPNAALAFLEGSEDDDVVVELTNPQLSGNDLSYTVKVLGGKLPASAGAASLFIDIIGMPLTPLSYAGATRRMVRRGAYYRY